jgi:hypothetical protein
MSVTPNNVTAFIGLEFPRGNDDDVAFTYPNSPFHLTSYAAKPFLPVLAFNHYTIETEKFCDYA